HLLNIALRITASADDGRACQAQPTRRLGGSASWTKVAPGVWRLRLEESERVNQHAQRPLRPRPIRQWTPRQSYEPELQVTPDDAGIEMGILFVPSRFAISGEHEGHRAKRYHRQVVDLR